MRILLVGLMTTAALFAPFLATAAPDENQRMMTQQMMQAKHERTMAKWEGK